MKLFKNILGSSNKVNSDRKIWKKLESEEDLEQAKQLSFNKKTVIFKHSTRCGVSRMVLKHFENEMALKEDEAEFFLLDLLSHRDLSKKITEDFGVEHQSPQMIVLENGTAIKNASHNEISVTII